MRSARYGLFLVTTAYPALAMAQALPAPFNNLVTAGKVLITVSQVCAGLYLINDGMNVGRAHARGDPQARQKGHDWLVGATWVFLCAAGLEWLKRSLGNG